MIRRAQLQQYISERLQKAKILLIGEALGYQGGHFSGIAMTSERILLGHKSDDGIHPKDVFEHLAPERTSKPSVKEKGFSENTATIVWKNLMGNSIDPYSIVLWNAFAWHPYDAEAGLLSNRTPSMEELRSSISCLNSFLSLFSSATPVAVGKNSFSLMQEMGISCQSLRHPAHGGANEFSKGLLKLFN